MLRVKARVGYHRTTSLLEINLDLGVLSLQKGKSGTISYCWYWKPIQRSNQRKGAFHINLIFGGGDFHIPPIFWSFPSHCHALVTALVACTSFRTTLVSCPTILISCPTILMSCPTISSHILLYYQARALRALGLLLADGAPTVGRGKTF